METCKNNLKTRRINFAQGDIKNVRTLLDKNGANMLKQVSPKKLKLATESLARMKVILIIIMYLRLKSDFMEFWSLHSFLLYCIR